VSLDAPWLLDPARPGDITRFLRAHAWIAAGDAVRSAGPAGDGNMNCTLRVVTGAGRLILKQGRPWVERYPEIPAPADRTLVEAAFYACVSAHEGVAGRMPRLVGIDHDQRVLVLDDCVGMTDLTGVYEAAPWPAAIEAQLLEYLAALHRVPVADPARAPWANQAMRALNHEYIFRLPLASNRDLHARLDSITPGLGALAAALSTEAALVAAVESLGECYLHGPPRALLHGDFFPGSWLSDGASARVIDPEFCFAGEPAFDYGVMAAHLILGGHWAAARRTGAAADAAGHDARLAGAFAGVEVMRRLIGVAQLPRLGRSLADKAALLQASRRLVLGLEPLAGA
jgi:5-methylthioribose kinase